MTDSLQIDALEDLALAFRRTAQRTPPISRRKRLLQRPALAAALASLTIAATATGSALILSQGAPIHPAPLADFTADQRPLIGSDHVSGVHTADPAGGAPWGLRVYRSKTGDPCAIVGQLSGTALGSVTRNTFHELPLSGPGTCVHLLGRARPLSMGTRKFVAPGEAPRTVIYGIAGPLVASIKLDNGTTKQTIVPGKDGAYLAVFEGYPNIVRTISFTDGTQDVLDPTR